MPCKNHPAVEEALVRCARCIESFCPDCYVELGGQPFCAECKVQRLLDLRAGTAPVVGQLRLASIGRRFGALVIDWMILFIPLMILLVIVTFAVLVPGGLLKVGQSTDNPVTRLILQWIGAAWSFFVGILYYGIQIARSGQTIGKRIVGLKVVAPDGSDLRPNQAWIRALVQQAFGILSCFGILIDCVTAFGVERIAIHDMAAKTRVVDWP